MPDAVPAPPHLPRAVTPRVWFTVGSIDVTTRRLVALSLLVLFIVALAVGWHQIDLAALHERAQALPGWIVVVAVCVLPLAGVPVAALHVAAGVRFGIGGGLAVVVFATLTQHLLGYLFVKLAPRVFVRRFAGWRQRFPRGTHGAMTVLAATMPGLPYFVPIYVLPMLGVPLHLLLLVGAPLHMVRAVVSIVGGDLSKDATPAKIGGLIIYYLSLTTVCVVTFRHVRTLLKAPKSTA